MPASRLTRRQLVVGAAAAFAPWAGRSAMAARQPRRGGVPRIALPRIPERVDTVVGDDWETGWIQSLVYDTPLRVTATGDIVAGVGVGLLTDPDGRSLDIPIRQGMFLSSGAVVTVRDLAASLERAIESTPDGDAWRWSGVASVEVVSEERVRLHVASFDATLPATLASPIVPVMPDGTPTGPLAIAELPPGTGPFVIANANDGQLRFRPNRLYREVSRPRFDGCDVIAVAQEIERTSRLVTGIVDIVPSVPLLDIPLLEEDPGVGLSGEIGRQQCAVIVRLDQHPLNDVEVRRLLAAVIDREALVEGATAGTARVSNSLFPTDHWAGSPNTDSPAPMEIGEARERLAALGLLPGWPVRLVCPEDVPVLANAAIMLQEQLAAAGIAVGIDLLDAGEVEQARSSGDFDLMMTFLPYWNDPHELAHPWFHSEGARNAAGFSNRRVDQLLAMARAVDDIRRRGALYREIQRLVAREVPVIPLFRMPWFDVARVRVEGYEAPSPPSARGVAEAWFGAS